MLLENWEWKLCPTFNYSQEYCFPVQLSESGNYYRNYFQRNTIILGINTSNPGQSPFIFNTWNSFQKEGIFTRSQLYHVAFILIEPTTPVFNNQYISHDFRCEKVNVLRIVRLDSLFPKLKTLQENLSKFPTLFFSLLEEEQHDPKNIIAAAEYEPNLLKPYFHYLSQEDWKKMIDIHHFSIDIFPREIRRTQSIRLSLIQKRVEQLRYFSKKEISDEIAIASFTEKNARTEGCYYLFSQKINFRYWYDRFATDNSYKYLRQFNSSKKRIKWPEFALHLAKFYLGERIDALISEKLSKCRIGIYALQKGIDLEKCRNFVKWNPEVQLIALNQNGTAICGMLKKHKTFENCKAALQSKMPRLPDHPHYSRFDFQRQRGEFITLKETNKIWKGISGVINSFSESEREELNNLFEQRIAIIFARN